MKKRTIIIIIFSIGLAFVEAVVQTSDDVFAEMRATKPDQVETMASKYKDYE